MKIKLLSLAAIVGISGLFITKMNDTNENIKITKYSPRVDENVDESYSAKGAAEYLASVRGDYKTGIVDPILLEKAQNHAYDKSSRASNLGLEFEFMGPSNMGGRTRGIVVDNENSDRIYGASITGGVYISTNGGNSWAKSWSARTNTVSCITQTSNGYLYAGTGCSFESGGQKSSGNGAPRGTGVGIYVSKDRGVTWELIESTSSATNKVFFRNVNFIEAHPTDANTIAAATNGGLQISTDGGVTWSREVACNGGVALSNCITVDWSNDGAILHAGFSGGQYYSGTSWKTSCGLTKQPNVGDGGRWMLSASPNDPQKVYATTSTGGDYSDVKVSTDGGANWASFNPPMPVSAGNFDLYGSNTQANYDMLFKALPNPNDASKDMLFIGGVQLWRFDGNWTQAAVGGGSGSEPGLYKVHVDHHAITYDKKNPKNIFFGNDGGIYKSLDGGYTFYDMNKGYSVTQYYAIAHANYDYAVGGTQDNGNPFVTPFRPGNPTYGATVFNQGVVNGDGFDAVVSQIVDLKYVSAQMGNMGRGKITSQQGSGACAPYCGMSSFYTNMKLWENANDLTSKDSVVFKVDTVENNIGLGSGSRTTFEGQIIPFQKSAEVITGSIKIGTNLDKLVYDGNGGFTGNGKGTLDEKTLKFSVTFDNAPPLNARVNAFYASNFAAGSVIIVPSATENLPIRHVINTNLTPGDILKVQDPVQSLIAIQVNQKCSLNNNGTEYDCDNDCYRLNGSPPAPNCGSNTPGRQQPGLALARKGIALGDNPDWMHLKIGMIQEFEFSPDGSEIFYNPNGNSTVRLIEGVENLYTQDDADKITTRQVFTAGSGNVTSINFNHQNPNEMLITVGNYGVVNHVYLLTRNGNNFTRQNVTGDLPDMPVYDAIFDYLNPKRVIIGTDQGVYSTADISQGANVEWTAEEFAMVPVFDIDQQTLSYKEATNHGMVYLGTHGAGIWKSGTIVGIDEITHKDFSNSWESNITIYPNPIHNNGQLEVTVSNPEEAIIGVYSINGQLQKTIKPSLQAGENSVSFDASDLSSGTYFVTLIDGNTKKVSKFVKM